MSYYDRIYSSFAEYHRQPLNIFLHLITTPICFLAALATLQLFISFDKLAIIVALYAISFVPLLPVYLNILNVLFSGALLLASPYVLTSLKALFPFFSQWHPLLILSTLFFLSYFGQDLAHFITAEATFQSSYLSSQNKLKSLIMLAEHTYFLIPLVLDVSIKQKLLQSILEFYVIRSYVLYTKCKNNQVLSSVQTIKNWLDGLNLAKDVTTHWWYSSLPSEIHLAFKQIIESDEVMNVFSQRYNKSMYVVEPVYDMNEVYVSTNANNKINSDRVFYSNHVDGPFMFLPFASVYRGVLVMNENKLIRTVFPESPCSYVLTEGDVCLFDFNREIHRIEQVKNEQMDQLRYSLKIHYAVYPRSLYYYGKLVAWLTTKYDIIARMLFLQTLRPQTAFDRILSRFILLCTDSTSAMMTYCGGASVLNYVLFMAVLSSILPINFPLFMYGTSFVHYAIYICTYYCRGQDVSFERFKHVVMAYKGLAIFHLAYHYVSNFVFSPLSLLLIFSGAFLSTSAALALGMDKTYFGYELGFVKDDGSFKVSSFPYNLGIPHPMIVGNLLWLCGFQIMPGMASACPHIAYIHASLYIVHMLQEHFDIHKGQSSKIDHHEKSQ